MNAIKALLKQATVKNGLATIQLECKLDEDAIEIMKRTGEEMYVAFTPEQQTITINDETGEVY